MNIARTLLSEQQTILIVDDTPANLGVLVDQLDEQRFRVVVAQDGEEGIQRARYVLPDIILLDVMMPGIDGFEVCSRLKNDELTQDIPVIFMTALTDGGDKLNGFEAGGVDYITKPFHIEEVVARVNTHLSISAMQRQLSKQNQQLQCAIRIREQVEADLHLALQEQQRLLEHAGVGMAFLKGERIIRCNQKLVALFGYSMEEMENLSLDMLYALEHTGGYVSHAAEQAHAKGETYMSDIRYQRGDGSCFWGETILTAIDDDDLSRGKILVINDIEQRKRAEALRAAQGQLFEMMATGSLLSDILVSLMNLIESQQDDDCTALFLVEGERILRISVAPVLSDDFHREIKHHFPEDKLLTELVGPCGMAARERQPVWIADMTQVSGEAEGYASLLGRHGLGACWSIPILATEGEVLGVLTLCFREPAQRDLLDRQVVDMVIRIAAIAIERQRAEDRIHFMAHHDALTGLPNRALLEDRLNQGILLAQRYRRQITTVFIDLDHFKMINDSLGHKRGDELLKIVAQRLEQCVRRTDTVVRLGGDEFILILYDQPSSTQTITPILNRIRETIAHPIQLAGHELRVTCSMGGATYPQDGEDAETLLSHADAAMYHAKEQGRNQYQFYDRNMEGEAKERLVLEEGLRHALENNELVLHYQPQCDLHSDSIIGMEVLLRWQHPEFGMLPPAKFIQLAETTGVIVPIGNWVLQTACQQNKAWQDAGFPSICVSVNVSARQFHEKDLPEEVARALHLSGLEPCYLELELTESMVMQDPQKAITTMQKLTEMGVRLSIDDFGTGYSSLSSLKNFPVTRLKIDKSFVTQLPDNTEDRSIAQAIITLGHSLNLKVIAEGVENQRQLAFLNEHRCDEIQGFYFGRPVPASEFETFMKTQTDRRKK